MTQPAQSYRLTPAKTPIIGTLTVAGDKSISHRSIMFGALADGVTRVRGFLQGEDALSTLQAFADMGVQITRDDSNVEIIGSGIDGLRAPAQPLDMGNSGTSMRLLSGILAAQPFASTLVGDASLSRRPMERVAKPLRLMGANIVTTGAKGTPPVIITPIAPSDDLKGIDYTLPVASAQIKSCLLFAALYAKGKTTITEREISRDHTERMLAAFGYPLQKIEHSDGSRTLALMGGARLTATDIDVPADISSAAFFMVAAAMGQAGSALTLTGVGINPTRTGVIEILRLMGVDIALSNQREVGGEPIADIVVYASELVGVDIPQQLVPLAIDEFPVLFIAASCACGKTRLTGARELRVKESDRIAVMADGLTKLGVNCTVLEDGIEIIGKGTGKSAGVITKNTTAQLPPIFNPKPNTIIDCQHDHRIAMSFAIASIRAASGFVVTGTQTVRTSFPNFVDLAQMVGVGVLEQVDSQ